MATDDQPATSSTDRAAVEQQRLVDYAASGAYPNVSPCPVGCKFCYERSLPEFYPNLKVERIRQRTPEQFDFYSGALDHYQKSAVPTSPVLFKDGTVYYHSASDFFAQGMTLEQLDRVMAANDGSDQAPYVSTMGKDFDLHTATVLTDKYPEAFRVRYSVLTFNDDIKRLLIPRWGSSEQMKQIVSVLRDSHVYLLHFSKEQTLADLRVIDAFANREHKPKVGIAVVNYTKLHADVVRKFSEDGFADFEDLIMHLMQHRAELTNIDELSFQHPPEAFAFRFRNVLRARVAPLLLTGDDLVLCSRGAHQIMSQLVVRSGATVVEVRDALGGSTSFTTTLATPDFLRELKRLVSERAFRRVIVPAPVWWVNQGANCLNGGTVDDLRAAFPELEIIAVEIPEDVIDARLTLQECYDYYNADLATTTELASQAGGGALALDPLDQVTEPGFIRTITLGGVAVAPDALRGCQGPATLTYDELIVERSDEAFPEHEVTPVERVRVTVGGVSRPARRALVRTFPLHDAMSCALFVDLFVDRKSCEDVGDLGRSLYATLADLELVRD